MPFGRPPGSPADLLHEDGSVCHHGRVIPVDYGDGQPPVQMFTLGGGVGYPCAGGIMITAIAGLPPLTTKPSTQPPD